MNGRPNHSQELDAMRSPFFLLPLALVALTALAGCGDDGEGVGELTDSDGDTITDLDEGRQFGVDTDGDGVPDYLSIDSDRDNILDRIEAGDTDPGTFPIDSDDDGIPDYRDTDSDGNGRPDSLEAAFGAEIDTDGDGVPDFQDIDDDGDALTDVEEFSGGNPQFPQDFDGDGVPDFKDPDSDDDFIPDGFEGLRDTDDDGDQDRFDLDSDDDGLSDAVEAGDDDLSTAPPDTDLDGLPDYRDPDSDGDGLPDGLEVAEGTDRFDDDSDADGVSDLIEVGYGSDPNDPEDNPRARGDFVFVAPFDERPSPRRDTLRFRTSIRLADVYFLFDTTGSMIGEIQAVRSTVETILDNLTCRRFDTTCGGDLTCPAGQICDAGFCIEDPELSGCISSLWTGVGTYTGNEDDYENLLSLQPDPAVTRDRIPPSASGGGANETLFESVACVANPSVCTTDCAAGNVMTPPMGAIGCPSFRPDAVKMLVTITDEMNECTSCAVNTAQQTAMELLAQNLTFVGVDADIGNEPQVDLTEIALRSDSLDSSRRPLYFTGDGPAVADAVTDAVREITGQVPLFVVLDQQEVDGVDDMGDPIDDGDALRFIERVEVNVTGGECTEIPASTLADLDGDGFFDSIAALAPGTPVCWNVLARRNTFERPGARTKIFQARLVVFGDDSPLDERRVYFVVPPAVPDVTVD